MSLSTKGLTTLRLVASRTASSAQTTSSSSATTQQETSKYIPPYKSSGSWSVLDRPNRVKMFQDLYSMESSDPIFLRGGASDVLLYRGIMGFSVLGIGIALFSIYRMATGSIQKKES